jgi:hypothetical protein
LAGLVLAVNQKPPQVRLLKKESVSQRLNSLFIETKDLPGDQPSLKRSKTQTKAKKNWAED